MEASSSRARWQDRCLTVVFVAMLFAPGVVYALRRDASDAQFMENRAPAELPARPRSTLDWADWPRAFEAWHNDHFGLRAAMLRAHSMLFIFGLHANPSPSMVVGREHWIYNFGTGIDAWRGAQPFSEAALEAWKDALESRRQEFAARSITYAFFIIPSKAEIYPEYLPDRYRKGGPSRLDQLTDHLAKSSSTVMVNLRHALLDEKSRDTEDDKTFFPLGIHWTERGALAGVREIVRELSQTWPALSEIDDSIVERELVDDPGDTLANQLYLPDLLKQRTRVVRLAASEVQAMRETRVEPTRTVIVDHAKTTLPRAVIFHDSFGQVLPLMLGRHFSRAVLRWETDIDFKLVDSEEPDIVLHILSDRILAFPPPSRLDAGKGASLRSAYQASKEIALRLDVASNTPRIHENAGGRVSVRGEGSQARVACSTDALSGTFLLPEFSVREGTHPIVRLEFESSVASVARVLYALKTDPTYSRRRQLLHETHIGLNELYFEIVDPQFARRLLFRPAEEVGTFLISALEVRLVAD